MQRSPARRLRRRPEGPPAHARTGGAEAQGEGSAVVGPDTASTLLVVAGDNPHRLHSEQSSAALLGSSAIPANSGKRQNRHRLNRGGDRQGNAALWRIALVRLSTDQTTRNYLARRVSEGKTKTEGMRCLKRYIARKMFNALPKVALI
jgi:transposase